MKRRISCFILLAACFLLPRAVQADYVFNGWDGGTVDGWLPATGQAILATPLSGGLNGGYLESYEETFTHGIVGAITYQPTHTGDYTAHGFVRIQVAVKFISSGFLSAYVHMRYLDSTHNGWQLPLNADFENHYWQLNYYDFDPNWTDQQAVAAGWIQESNTPSFAETMAQVYSAGVKATGIGALSVGIDHFSLQDAATASDHMAWGDIKSLYR